MARQQRSGISKKIINLLLIIPALYSLTGHLFSMLRLEMASARKRIMLLLVLAIFSFALLISFWLCINAIILYYLISMTLQPVMAIVFLMLFNALLLAISCLIMSLLKVDVTFPETRRALRDILSE